LAAITILSVVPLKSVVSVPLPSALPLAGITTSRLLLLPLLTVMSGTTKISLLAGVALGSALKTSLSASFILSAL
jgi:hypothetical protein